MSSATVANPPPPCEFPLFRSKFLSTSNWGGPTPAAARGGGMNPQERVAHKIDSPSSAPTPATAATPTLTRPNLRSLDLRALPRDDDGPPSETQLRRQKYLYFEKHCSEVSPGLFLSGDYVAKNRETLAVNGVTHVLNCVGFICKEYFKDELTYKTLYLQDTPAEDIACVLYDSLDYIDTALSSGGRVLVHCSQGVSRSATLAIAYIMWRSRKPYEEVFATVKSIRGVANPNIGFTCQLLQWQKRVATSHARLRMYRIASHCSYAPGYLVPKLITPPRQFPHNTHRDLDPRGAFVMSTPGGPTYVWRGEACPEPYAEAARRAAAQLRKFEGAGPIVEARQGQEPLELLALLDPPPLDPEAARINAKRSSITGEILLPSGGMTGGGAPPTEPGQQQQQQQPGEGSGEQQEAQQALPASNSNDMDVDVPELPRLNVLTTGGLGLRLGLGGWASSRSSMELSTPTVGRGLGAGGSGADWSPAGTGAVQRWVPQEVDEYSEDYSLFWHHQHQLQGAGSGGGVAGAVPYDPMVSGIRASYDTAAGPNSLLGPGASGAAGGGVVVPSLASMPSLSDPVAHLSAAGALGLLAGPGGRPESPATKDGRGHKKYRRADSERPKLGYWTAACSDGIGPELARTHNVSSLHESVDEDLMGMSPHVAAGAAQFVAAASGGAVTASGYEMPEGLGSGGAGSGTGPGAGAASGSSNGPLEWRATAPM